MSKKVNKKLRRLLVERKIVECLINKKSFNQISQNLHVCKKTIKKIQKKAEVFGYLSGTVLPALPAPVFPLEESQTKAELVLAPYIDWIQDRRKAGWHWITIYEELNKQINIPRASFFRFTANTEIFPRKDYGRLRITPEIISKPGETLYLDWGLLCQYKDSDGKKKNIWVFAAVLGFSRYMCARVVYSNTIEETLKALESIFLELGGVPKIITTDNPKCFSIEASKYEAILNLAFERFAAHYSVIIDCLPPRDPQKKGKVERQIPYLRRLYEGSPEWEGIELAQKYLDERLIVANRRTHGTTRLRPEDQFLSIEKQALLDLPALSFKLEKYHSGKVRCDGFIYYNYKYYCVGIDYALKEVFIIATEETVIIYYKGKLIESYDITQKIIGSKYMKPHHYSSLDILLQNHGPLIESAEKKGEYIKKLIVSIVSLGRGFVDTRKVFGILNLDKKYSLKDLNEACEFAFRNDDLSYRAVLNYLEKKCKRDLNLDTQDLQKTTIKNSRFVRDITCYQ